MGAILSNPSVSKEQVQTMVQQQMVPIQNSSQSIDKKLNMVVSKITDQIMQLKELMADQKEDYVKSLQEQLQRAERDSDFSNLSEEDREEQERQIEAMRQQLEDAESEANAARKNAASIRREKNELDKLKLKANSNLAEAKAAAANAQALIQKEKEASLRAISAAQEASAKEKEAYLASTSEEKERLTTEAASLRNAAAKATMNAKSFQSERNAALEAKTASEVALAAEKEAKEAAILAEQLAKNTEAKLRNASNAERANLQSKLKVAQNNAEAKRQEANALRLNANSAKANAKIAKEEAQLHKQKAANAEQAKVNAEQAVANAKATAAKAQQNANAAIGEEKRKLEILANRSLQNLQEKQAELNRAKQNAATAAANLQGQLQTAKANTESARGEAQLAKQELANAQQAKAAAEQSVANAKAVAAKAQQNANAAIGEEKRKLEILAKRAANDLQMKETELQEAKVEAIKMLGALATAEHESAELGEAVRRAAEEKAKFANMAATSQAELERIKSARFDFNNKGRPLAKYGIDYTKDEKQQLTLADQARANEKGKKTWAQVAATPTPQTLASSRASSYQKQKEANSRLSISKSRGTGFFGKGGSRTKKSYSRRSNRKNKTRKH